jgi:hypothetical protein
LVKSKERATIAVRRPDDAPLLRVSSPNGQVRISFENIGQSNALNVKWKAGARVIEEGGMFDPKCLENLESSTVVRPNESEGEMAIPIKGFKAPPQAMSIPNQTIHAAGILEYEDVFGDFHATPFHYVLEIPVIEKNPVVSNAYLTSSAVSWKLSDDDPGNTAT